MPGIVATLARLIRNDGNVSVQRDALWVVANVCHCELDESNAAEKAKLRVTDKSLQTGPDMRIQPSRVGPTKRRLTGLPPAKRGCRRGLNMRKLAVRGLLKHGVLASLSKSLVRPRSLR